MILTHIVFLSILNFLLYGGADSTDLNTKETPIISSLLISSSVSYSQTIYLESTSYSSTEPILKQLDSNSTVPNFQSFEEWKKNKLNQGKLISNNSSLSIYDKKISNNSNTNIKNDGFNDKNITDIVNDSNNQSPDNRSDISSDLINEKINQNDSYNSIINNHNNNLISNNKSNINNMLPYHQQRIKKRNDNNDDINLSDDMVIEMSMFAGLNEDQGKLYKDRFNYASFDCAATIVKTNKEAKGANSILLDNKDTYLLNECSAINNFIIIELCEDILIDEILIGNYEFYSSMFKDLKIFASDRFPTTQWYLLGEFKAENIRKLQTFHIENPLIWSKFIKIEFLSHYGNEFYCPISSVQVHGTTMIEQFKEENPEIKDSNNDLLLIKNESNNEFNFEIDEINNQINNQINKINFEISNNELNCTSPNYLKLDQFLIDYEEKFHENFDQCLIDDYDENLTKENNNLNENDKNKIVETSTLLQPKVQPQDSIYKNLAKRLSLLESNATLSLLYIEEQSKLLSEAFNNLEQEQSIKFQNILTQLNSTIQSQMSIFQKLNIDVYTSFSRLFEFQQQNFDENTLKISNKINEISNLIAFYKYLTYLSLIIIISLFIYLIMTKNVYIDDSLINNYNNRLNNLKSPNISPTNSMLNLKGNKTKNNTNDNTNNNNNNNYNNNGNDFKDIKIFTPDSSTPASPRAYLSSNEESDYIFEE